MTDVPRDMETRTAGPVTPVGEVRPGVPSLRGVMHQYAVILAVALAAVIVILAPSARARAAAIVYSVGLCTCLGTSAVYHRGRWSARIKDTLCRVDHSMIFLLIAGTSTPIILLAVHGTFGTSLLVIQWTGAAVGIGIALLWRRPPVWVEVAPYMILGWLGLLAVPALVDRMGWTGPALLAAGGALYSIGVICYAFERPNPWPRHFGFHEIFHIFVTAAASVHAVLITMLILAT